MLNELYGLARTLDSCKISVDEWHREYQSLPKVTRESPCIRIWLGNDASVTGLESISADLAGVLRKYGNKQGTFPAFNINPLYRITDMEFIAELDRLKHGKASIDVEKVKSWCIENNWTKGLLGKVMRCLTMCPKKLLEKLDKSLQLENIAIFKLIELCKTMTPNGFRVALEDYIFRELKAGENIELCLSLLFHPGNSKKDRNKDTGTNHSVILDVQDWDRYAYPVANEHTTAWINKQLLLLSGGKIKTPTNGICVDAFGMQFENPEEPMPVVKMESFPVTLRSMFNGQPCQYRYGRIADESYPISAENRSATKKALEWLAVSSRKRITWEKIDKDEIVFVYPSKLPEVSPTFVSLLAVSEASYRFESMVKEFIKVFHGIPIDQKPDTLQIFTIRKMDRARSKVIFTHNTTPEQLICSAEKWSHGCRNLPEMDFGEVITPYPLGVANIVNAVWKQDGKRADGKTPVERMKYYQGIELLLDMLPSNALQRFIHITLENSLGLVNHLGNDLHRRPQQTSTTDRKDRNTKKIEPGDIFVILGLLLHKCGIGKENYMENLPYLLGQLLHVSDELHTMYCKVKRNGDIPPQLAGNALFVAAGGMPFQALSQLSTRMIPYIAWAKQYRYKGIVEKGMKSTKAAWLLNSFQSLTTMISPQMDKAIRFGDFEKAQLFIGYMASLPQKEELSTENNENETTGVNGNE